MSYKTKSGFNITVPEWQKFSVGPKTSTAQNGITAENRNAITVVPVRNITILAILLSISN